MLNVVIAKAHRASCVDIAQAATVTISSEALENDIVGMFLPSGGFRIATALCRPLL